MSVFPILRLPFVASKAAVDRMDLGDITSLFLCSKKIQKLIKAMRKSVSFISLSIDQKNSLNCLEIYQLFREENREGTFLKEYAMKYGINFSNDMGFLLDVEYNIQPDDSKNIKFYVFAECVNRQDEYEGTKRNLQIGNVIVPAVMTDKNHIYTFWPEKQKGFRIIGEYLRKMITSSPSNLFIIIEDHQEFSAELSFIINWMKSTNQIPRQCKIYDVSVDKIIKDDIKFILDNVHPTKYLEISAKLGEEFEHNAPFKSDRLHLSYANWFTLNNLLMTDCDTICLDKSKLSNDDLNKYLKQWMAGKFPKLRRLDVRMQEDMNIDVILSGLEDSQDCIKITRKKDSVHLKWNDGHLFEISTSGTKPKRFEMFSFDFRPF